MKRSFAKLESSSRGEPTVLYDGVCGLCNGWVKFLLAVDTSRAIQFAPLAGETATRLRTAHPELSGLDSIIWIEANQVATRSTAVLRILRYLGGFWQLGLVGYLIPREIRDSLYDVVAYWRYRLFGRYDRCPLPPPETRHRFLP